MGVGLILRGFDKRKKKLITSLADRRRHFLALGIVAAAYALSFFHRFAPTGIAHDLAVDFQTSATSLGVLAATYFYVYTVMQIPTGILVDTMGSRRILLLGGLVSGLGSMIFGTATNLDTALIGRTITGLGVSVTFIAMLKIIAISFEENRFATLVGVAMVIGNLGSVLAGAPLTLLAQHSGWRGVFMGVGVVSIALGVACWMLVRDQGAGTASDDKPKFDRSAIFGSLLSVIRNPLGWPATLVNAGIAGTFFAFGGLWAVPFLTRVHDMSRTTASSHVSLYFAGFAAGCLLIGSISDRIRKRKPVVIVVSHVYCLIWFFWLTGFQVPVAVSYALFALMGICSACFTLTWSCAKEVNPPHLSGMSTAVTNMGGFLAGAILQPLVGYAMDLSWAGEMVNGARVYQPEDFRFGMMLLTAVACLGAFFTWRLKETGCRNIWQDTV